MKPMVYFAIALFLVAAITGCTIHNTTQDTVAVTVTGKERVTKKSGNAVESYYLIFTDTETFKNEDSLWALKFNSSDLYGSLREGQTCELTVVGFRVNWLSMYRNIIEANCE